MSEPNTIEDVANRAAKAAKEAMGVEGDNLINLCGSDLARVTDVVVELIKWDAARMVAEAEVSRRKPIPPEARS